MHSWILGGAHLRWCGNPLSTFAKASDLLGLKQINPAKKAPVILGMKQINPGFTKSGHQKPADHRQTFWLFNITVPNFSLCCMIKIVLLLVPSLVLAFLKAPAVFQNLFYFQILALFLLSPLPFLIVFRAILSTAAMQPNSQDTHYLISDKTISPFAFQMLQATSSLTSSLYRDWVQISCSSMLIMNKLARLRNLIPKGKDLLDVVRWISQLRLGL